MTSADAATVLQFSDLAGHVGKHLGYSGWHLVDQDQINRFADATGDHQWIHVDAERAAAGPFGTTIAHGYFTLSLTPVCLFEILRVEGVRLVVNYGLNKVRFPAPVPSGSKVRLGAELTGVEDISGGVQATVAGTYEVEGQSKPACVAEIVFRYYS
jgi:acyl dehydratase